jgi:hemolysin activation/secretion protein
LDRRALLLPLCLLPHAACLAQQAPITPGGVQSTVAPDKPAMPATPAQVMVPMQSPPSPHDPRARRFRVNAFTFVGNTAFSSRTLKTQIERYVDLELNLYDLNLAADAITEFYHERGYTLARATIPPQKIVDGDVQIRVVEGRIGRVSFSGNERHSTDFLALRSGALRPDALVTSGRLETTLLLLNDIPGLSAKAVLSPGEEFGHTDAEIKITEKLLGMTIAANNHGRQETGKNKLDTTFTLNSPFGWGDQLAVSASSTEHRLVKYWKVGYSAPLNTLGTRVAIGNSKVAYQVSGALAALGLTGDVHTTDLTISHPLTRTRAKSEWVSFSAKRSHLEQYNLGFLASQNDLTVYTIGYQMSRIHADASLTNLNLNLASNAKSVGNPARQDAVLARWEADVNHTTPFSGKWDLYLRGNIVYSREMLPDTEKFSLGGPGSVRAYRPSEVRGDTGYLAQMEFRHPFAFASRAGSFRMTADWGQVIYKMPGFTDSRDNLKSVGVGASFYPFSGAVLSVDVARRVGRSQASNAGGLSRAWVSFSASF